MQKPEQLDAEAAICQNAFMHAKHPSDMRRCGAAA
jgi:hypothetical protein